MDWIESRTETRNRIIVATAIELKALERGFIDTMKVQENDCQQSLKYLESLQGKYKFHLLEYLSIAIN